jgi:indolepyruvate ferredoxin oxidoreductase beta subunit
MLSNCYTIVITGLGGQGLIKFLEILGDCLMKEGYRVISAETHGLSQRGGKVTCFLRFGNKLNAPIPMIGTADMIIALEESTIINTLNFAKPDKSTKLIISTYEKHIIGTNYPTIQALLENLFEHSNKIYLIPAMEIAEKILGNPRVMNGIILGYITKFLSINEKILEKSIKEHFMGTNLELNLRAFNEGLNL